MRNKTWINALTYLSFTALSALLGMLGAVLMAHLLEPQEYGRLGVFLSALYVVAPLVSLSAEGLIAVNKAALSEQHYERFQRTTVGMSLLAAMAVCLLLVLAVLAGVLPDPLLLFTPLFALLRFWATMAGTEYVAEQRPIAYGCVTVLNGLTALGLTWLLMQLMPTAGSRVLALICADALLMLVRYRGRLHRLARPMLDLAQRRQILAFGLPSMVALLGAWGLNEADKVIVARQIDLHTAGLYTAAATLAAVMMSFYQALTNAFFPALYRQLGAEPSLARSLILPTVGRFLGLSIMFALLLVLGYEVLGARLLPPRYAQADIYFVGLVAALVPIGLYRPIGLFIDFFKMSRIRAVAISIGGLSSVTVAWFGTQQFGNALWAAAGIGTGYSVAALILLAALLRYADPAKESAR